jgi:hypothetical protein
MQVGIVDAHKFLGKATGSICIQNDIRIKEVFCMRKTCKVFYMNIAFLLVFVWSHSVGTSWSAERALFLQNGKGLYDTLQSLSPGNPMKVAYEILGAPDGQESNVLIWHLLDKEVGATFCIVPKGDMIGILSYFEYLKTKQLVLDRYSTLQKDLSLILSSPAQVIPNFASVWYVGDFQLALLIDLSKEENLCVGAVLKVAQIKP